MRLAATFCLLLLLTAVLDVDAQVPGSVPIEDLQHTRDWTVVVDDEEVPGAEVYVSEYEVAWMLRVPGHGSFLLSPRGDNSVQRVDEGAFRKAAGVDASLEALGTDETVARYKTSWDVMTFTLGDHTFELRPTPPVLGHRAAVDLGKRHPAFDPRAAAYRDKAAARTAPLEKSAAEDVTVRVYFGSWSPICERIVPKMMAVEAAWHHVRFEYYGLPQPLTDDPHAVEMGLTGVPTVVIFRGGEEMGRLQGRQLDSPEEAIGDALTGL